MEIDLVVQKKLKPNSTEIETKLMKPNDAFWTFLSEVQPSDLKSSCFAEELDIIQDEKVVGYLKVHVKHGSKMKIGNEEELPVITVYAETKGENDEFEIFQSIESTMTEDLNLIKETKTETTQLLTKVITTEYIPGHGYKMKREVTHHTDDEAWQNPGDGDFEMSFLCDESKVILSDGCAIMIQRLIPKIGVYQIDLPYLDIDSKLVSLSSMTALGFKTVSVEGEEFDLVGLQRKHNLKHGPHIYNLWLFEDGHIAHRESAAGNLQLNIPHKPVLIKDEEDLEPVINLPPLDWHNDMQLRSIYRQRATQLSSSHATYLKNNDQLMKMMRNFYTSVLEQKPENIYNYAADYFNTYAS